MLKIFFVFFKCIFAFFVPPWYCFSFVSCGSFSKRFIYSVTNDVWELSCNRVYCRIVANNAINDVCVGKINTKALFDTLEANFIFEVFVIKLRAFIYSICGMLSIVLKMIVCFFFLEKID